MKIWWGMAFCLTALCSFSQQKQGATELEAAPEQISVRTKADAVLRKKPKERARTLAELPAGLVLKATDAKGLFLLVTHEDQPGWIHASQLQFDQNGMAFMRARAKQNQGGGYDSRRRRMAGGAAGEDSADLQQCAHVDGAGRRCLYQTGDDSGYCPEHKH